MLYMNVCVCQGLLVLYYDVLSLCLTVSTGQYCCRPTFQIFTVINICKCTDKKQQDA